MNRKRQSNSAKRAIVGLLFVLSALTAAAQEYNYSVRRGEVYYNGTPVRNADAHTLRILGYGYAKDRSHVYLHGRILEHVDPRTFRLKEGRRSSYDDYREPFERHRERGYRKLGTKVLYNGRKVEDASTSSFEDLGYGYAKDAFRVYCFGKEVSDASTLSFQVLGGGYAKDAFTVFYLGKEMHDASVTSFKYDEDGYAHDAFNNYFEGRKISD